MVFKIPDEMRAALGENPGKPLMMSDEAGKSYILMEEKQYQISLDQLGSDFGYSDDRLRQLIQEGLDSGPSIPASQALAELREYADQLARRS
jgi:hypothetical protein